MEITVDKVKALIKEMLNKVLLNKWESDNRDSKNFWEGAEQSLAALWMGLANEEEFELLYKHYFSAEHHRLSPEEFERRYKRCFPDDQQTEPPTHKAVTLAD